MPGSWRHDVAKMKNRWLLIAVVVVSLLFHAGVIVLLWKVVPAVEPPEEKPIFVDLVKAPSTAPGPSYQGKIVDKKLPANEKRPDRADVISHKDNRVDKETHRRDIPFNEITKDVGAKAPRKGSGRRPGPGGPDKGGKGRVDKPDRGGKSPGPKSTKDLINSVGYRNLPNVKPGSSSAGGGGNVSPYNPKIGSPGDAININTKSFKYMSYFASIKEKIEWAWVYPQEAQMRGEQGMLTITFTILRNGKLQEVKLVKSSGYHMLDRAAMQAVRDAAAFPPMPKNWEDEELSRAREQVKRQRYGICSWCDADLSEVEGEGPFEDFVSHGAFQERYIFCSEKCMGSFRKRYPPRIHRNCYEKDCNVCDMCIKRYDTDGFRRHTL